MAKKTAVIFGIILILIGITGLLPNPIIGAGGKAIFETNLGHNLLHLLMGVVMLVMATKGEETATLSFKIFGAIFLLTGILGFVMKSPLFGIVAYNSADNWANLMIGIVLIALGMIKKSKTAQHPPIQAV